MYELGWLASWLDGREEYSFDGWMDGGKDRWFCPQAALLSATSAEAEAIVVQWLKDGRDDPLRPAHYTWIFMNVHGYPLLCMDINLLYMDMHRHTWTPMD